MQAKILINLQLSQSEPPTPRPAPRIPLEERINQVVDMVECEECVDVAYAFLAKLIDVITERIKTRPPTKKEIRLLKLARPAIEKFELMGKLQMPAKFWDYITECEE